MVERITPAQYEEADGVDDWRVVDEKAQTCFRTGSFVTGLALVNAIGGLAEAANHHPDITLTYPTVVVSINTHEVGGLSQRDVDLTRQISAAARDLGVEADPAGA
jgi:4a-hydroxytetrahydrobiopterin dehydratase